MSFKAFLMQFILAFLLGCIAFYYVVNNTALNSAPTPWIILTLLLFSSSYCIQALFKIPEVDEHPSLTSDELRRLRPIISIKRRRLTVILCYHIIAAVVVAVGFFSIKTCSEYFQLFFVITGGLVISSLYTFLFIKSNMDEAQRFKSILIHRSDTEKRRKDILDSLNKKSE
ncbi:hypothetical protein EC843_101696 [Buttiauxella sp. JUb87]|uniref:hypothetical protein n=1 Tax=Buttiauxella sp. JUb87 TaxID=2485129 RepID=UPI001060FAD1|nr:hypothetical protein [Buttiauxella sp. JUb87]TDN54645.1 hypothetical protein EC843_101696 [Buttiauxella sp. JUb87]